MLFFIDFLIFVFKGNFNLRFFSWVLMEWCSVYVYDEVVDDEEGIDVVFP